MVNYTLNNGKLNVVRLTVKNINQILDILVISTGAVSVILWLLLNIHNITRFIPQHGFDASDHIEYIRFIQMNKSIPGPDAGWEMYHPPLYYILMSFIPDIKTGQFLNLILYILGSVLISVYLIKTYKNIRYAVLGTIFCLSLPAVIYLIPQISNEVLLFLLVTAGLIYYHHSQNRLTRKNCLMTGIISGLCLMTKYTGMIFLCSIIIDILIKRNKNPRSAIKPISIILLTSFMLSGWMYSRNTIKFGNPFISNIDLFPIVQVPDRRELSFFTDISAFLKNDYYNSRYYSFWGGVYYSFFHDEHNVIIPSSDIGKTDPGLTTKPIGILFVIAAGYVFTILKKRSDRIFVIYFTLSVLAFMYYCFRYPTATSVKGIYLLSVILPLCVFGLNFLKKYRLNIYFFYGYILLYFLTVMKNFWIPGL